MYYVDWCGYCKKAKPEFEKLIQNYKGIIQIKMMDAEADENKELVHSQNIRTFPTIRYYPSGIQYDYQDYNENRNYNDFINYLSNKIHKENYEDAKNTPPLDNNPLDSIHDIMLSDYYNVNKLI
jgi:thiol-disulfide isomerase/thioredoxin